MLDSSGLVQLSWPDRNSLEAQVTPRLNRRADHRLTWADAIPLDTFCALVGSRPSLVKIDAEGSEPAVLRGAAHLLASSKPPAILFEFSGLLCDLRTRSTEQVAGPCYVRRSLLSRKRLSGREMLMSATGMVRARVGTAEALVRARPHCRNRAQPIGLGACHASALGASRTLRWMRFGRFFGSSLKGCETRVNRINGHLGRQKCEIRDRPHVVHRLSSLTPNSAHSQLKS